MTSELAQTCAGLLLEYQGVVVHDLRGDLNGLLLTVDFLRRQLAARPEVAALLGETLGDLGQVRGALNRTLGQLDLVGQARRVLANPASGDIGRLNLAEAVAAVVQNQLGGRPIRRGVTVVAPTPANIQVRVDPALLHLALERLLCGWADLARDTAMRVAVERSPSAGNGVAVVRAVFDAPQRGAAEAASMALLPAGGGARSGPVAAIRLARCLIEGIGGRVRPDALNREISMELPDAEEAPVA